jgi:hypothetical protein
LITGTFGYDFPAPQIFCIVRSFCKGVLHAISSSELGSQDILQPT